MTTLIVGGAVAASYAALSNQSKRATQAPKIVRVVAAAPTTPAPATPPAATTKPPATATPAIPKLPTTTNKPPAIPKATATPKVVVPPISVPKPTPTPTPSTGNSNQTGQVGRAILLDPNAANTYNPYGLSDSSFGDPSLAIDGDSTTAWTYALDPSTAGKTLMGLTIDLKSPQRFRSLKIHVTSPGMTVEFYGATGEEPVSITDPAWIHLANRSHIKRQTSVALKTQGKSFRWLLAWITHAPANQTTGTVGIAELSVIR